MSNFTKVFISLISIFCLCLFACEGGGIGGDDDASDCYYDVDESSVDNDSLVWGDARIFHPCDIENSSAKFDATTLTGGMFNTKESMFWLAEYLSNEGDMIAIAVTASAFITTYLYEDAHKAGVYVLKAENANPNSPLYKKLGKIAVAGYSLGGGGALQAAHDLGDEIDAVIAMAPYSADRDLSGIVVPALCMVGSSDTTASPGSVHNTFEDLPTNIPRAYAELNNETHFYWVNNSDGELGKIMTLAWLKYYLSGDASYYNTIINPPSGIVDYEFEN